MRTERAPKSSQQQARQTSGWQHHSTLKSVVLRTLFFSTASNHSSLKLTLKGNIQTA